MRAAIGGVLDHLPDLMPWYAPTINSYRRTTTQDFAGNGLTWGFDNRTVSTRVLTGSPQETRLEFRLPGADVNPYLALSALLASMDDGIQRGAHPGPPHGGDAYADHDRTLPQTLLDAANLFAGSSFVAEAFGKDVVRHYQAVAEFEWNSFMKCVTDWERERYLEGI